MGQRNAKEQTVVNGFKCFLIVFTTTYAFVYYNDGLNKNNRKLMTIKIFR